MKTKKITDAELISNFRNGNNDAFGEIVTRHSSSILLTIKKAGIKDTLLAEDILQETFIKAMDALQSGKYRETSQVKNWLNRIARNLTVDFHRKKHRIPSLPEGFNVIDDEHDDKQTFEPTYRLESHEESPEDFTIKMELVKKFNKEGSSYSSEIIEKMLNKLSHEQKKILILRYFLHMPFKQIAEAEKIPINTALARARYALISLRKFIKELSEDTIEALKIEMN